MVSKTMLAIYVIHGLILILCTHKNLMFVSYRFPRVFGDKFGAEFGDLSNFVTKLVTNLVIH